MKQKRRYTYTWWQYGRTYKGLGFISKIRSSAQYSTYKIFLQFKLEVWTIIQNLVTVKKIQISLGIMLRNDEWNGKAKLINDRLNPQI